MITAGWNKNQIQDALSLNDQTIPVPLPTKNLGMWVAFQYIILFITLYISFTALSGITHFAVDKYIPDTLSYSSTASDSFNGLLMQGYLAMIIVSFPIFAVLFLVTKRQAMQNPQVKLLTSRKILIYITLICTFLIMVYRLIYTVYQFTSGASTLNSFVHFCVTMGISGSIFAYLIMQVLEDKKSAY